MSKNTLLVSVATLKARSAVHNNVDEKLLLPELKVAQDMEIQPALGSALFNRLIAGVEADDLSSDEETLIDDYITDAVMWFVLMTMPVATSFQFFTKGVVRTTGDNVESLSMGDLVEIAQYYRKRAEFYRERLIRYLQENSTLYTQYSYSSDNDINPSSGGYTMQLYLEDDECGCTDEP